MRTLGWSLLTFGVIGIAQAAAPDDVGYLREQYAILQSLPPARQQQLRDLDREFHALDEDTQKRLQLVMERYNYWLTQLPEAERKRVVDAATAHERFTIIQELKDREWIETLPKPYREKYAKANASERSRLVSLWREEQNERREEWQFVRRNWEDIKNDRFDTEFQKPEFSVQLEAYAANLESQVMATDRERIKRAREMSVEERARFRYFATLLEISLSDRYGDRGIVLLPGPPDGPRTFDALPMKVKESLEKDRAFGKKKQLPKELQSTQGRWPDFAIAVTKYARDHSITLPEGLGPTTKAGLPTELQGFIDDKLMPTLTKLETGSNSEQARQARSDLARLKDAEGKWPDYPRTVMDLAKQYKLYVPNWMLPGKPETWERYRPKLDKKK